MLNTKLIFKTKRDIDGYIIKYEARIVIRGFKQQYDKNFNQTFTKIYRNIIQKIIVTITTLYNLKIE